ncbi:hypothetical protein BGZ70_007754 [Mortierella alpina]|uniref:Uncharacterized protein n=1 Tax=Mortierella alpina TaxID=64518 RepID=A0A9P6J519_MORAP|nr:hypothetical protein BGZ70_007754 [Mortierella alpina]
MRPTRHHLLLALGFSLLTIVLAILYSLRHSALDSLLSSHVSASPKPSRPPPLTRPPAPKSRWDPTQKYLVYLPFEGISNQFYSLQNAATMAKRLNRTLVVPPITSNRHDRLGTNQPWSHYMDLEHMALHAGVQLVEWHAIKPIDTALRRIIKTGSRRSVPKAWRALAESLPCQIIRSYGHDYFVGEEDSIGADFAYQYLLNLKPVPVPGYSIADNVAYVAQFERGRNRWDVGWTEAGQYLRFLPRFASYVEDLISYRFGLLEDHIHPRPPVDLGTSILDKGYMAETFLSRKPPLKEYIAIHLRRGDIAIKCLNQTSMDCIVPLTEYKAHVDAILASLPEDSEKPHVVLVSDTQSEQEKSEIDSYGWYRLDHAKDANLLEAAKVLGPFSPALIDSAVLTGRGARWVVGSRKSTMSWLAAMRASSWFNRTIIYPRQPQPHHVSKRTAAKDLEDDSIATWDRDEHQYFDLMYLT